MTNEELLQKKLDIATKALNRICNPTIGDIYNQFTDEIDYVLVTDIAEEALQEIDLVGTSATENLE